jgi:hypothetical protein
MSRIRSLALALPPLWLAMLTRSSAWLPPGANDGNWLTTERDYG